MCCYLETGHEWMKNNNLQTIDFFVSNYNISSTLWLMDYTSSWVTGEHRKIPYQWNIR